MCFQGQRGFSLQAAAMSLVAPAPLRALSTGHRALPALPGPWAHTAHRDLVPGDISALPQIWISFLKTEVESDLTMMKTVVYRP